MRRITVRKGDGSLAMSLSKTVVLIVLAVTALVPQHAAGGGVLHAFPPVVDSRPVPVARPAIISSKSLVTVSESAIEYRINQTFYNDNEFPVEGLFVLPLEKLTPACPPELRIDGIVHQGEVLSAEEFFPILRKLTEQMRDPALLGLAGRDVLVVRDVKLGIRKQKTFRVAYRTPVAIKDHLVEIYLPLDGERYALAPVTEFEISVRFKMSRPIKTLFSPSHPVSVFREAPHRALVSLRRTGKRVRSHFRLLGVFGGPGVDLKVLTHRLPGENGYFMAVVGAPSFPGRAQEPDKDLVFVADVSGSLDGTWRERMKRALSFCLGKLRGGDRFNVLAAGTRVSRMSQSLVFVSDKGIFKAIQFMDSVGTPGGTDLYNALMIALEQFTSRSRQRIVVLISDGRSTVGITDSECLIDDVKKHNRHKARVFVLAVGDRPNVALLDRLAVATRGRMLRFSVADDFQSTMSRFLSDVSPPQVHQLALDFGEMSPRFVYPDQLPDIYRRESILIVGRYPGKEDTTVRVGLKWKMEDRSQRLSQMIRFPLVDPHHPYLASLWAMRRFGWLVERDLMKGPDHVVRQKIRLLAERFGFKTPPSMEHKHHRQPPGERDADLSSILWNCKTATSAHTLMAEGYRSAGGRVFRRESQRWVDTRFKSSLTTRKVESFSNDYFALLQQNPQIGPCLALGPDVTLVLGDQAVAVFPKL